MCKLIKIKYQYPRRALFYLKKIEYDLQIKKCNGGTRVGTHVKCWYPLSMALDVSGTVNSYAEKLAADQAVKRVNG